MIILALETSCDETAAAVVRRTSKDAGIEVLSNVVATSLELHMETGGVVPEVAAREQLHFMLPVIKEALAKAKVDISQIDAIGVTYGPGLIGSLLVGVESAKALALAWKKPLIPVNHLLGHVLVNWVRKVDLPTFPALGVVVSGGHTDLVWFDSASTFTWIGGTRDDAAGECFDKCARMILNAPYPGGPAISKAAAQVKEEAKPFLPRPMIHEPSLEMSFSGLKTAVSNALKTGEYSTEEKKAVLSYDLERAISDILIAKIELALEMRSPSCLLVGGGVVANRVFREELDRLRERRRIALYYPPLTYCSDNGVMIGSTALLNSQPVEPLTLHADPSLAF